MRCLTPTLHKVAKATKKHLDDLAAQVRPPLLAATIGAMCATGLGPDIAYAGGLGGDFLRAVGLKRQGDDLDREHAKIKKNVKVYGATEEGVARAYREAFRWIKRHPEEALAIALVVATAGVACADGCTVLVYVMVSDVAAGGAAAVAIPIAIYEGDRKDRIAARDNDQVRSVTPAQATRREAAGESRMQISAKALSAADAKPTRTVDDVKPRLGVLTKPEFGKLPSDPNRYTVVPGLSQYSRLQPHERGELARNRAAAMDMPRREWVDRVWSGHAWDYKHQNAIGWGPSYATFGNINYGMTGDILWGSPRILFAGAGAAQQLFGESRHIYDGKNGSFLSFFDPLTPNDALFGDMPEDHQAIDAGIKINRNFDLIRTIKGDAPFGLEKADVADVASTPAVPMPISTTLPRR